VSLLMRSREAHVSPHKERSSRRDRDIEYGCSDWSTVSAAIAAAAAVNREDPRSLLLHTANGSMFSESLAHYEIL